MHAKIRWMHLHDKLWLFEIVKRTGLLRNMIRNWLITAGVDFEFSESKMSGSSGMASENFCTSRY